MTRSALYVLGSYPRWSEAFVRQDLMFLLQAGVPLQPVALFPGDTVREPGWPEVRCLTPTTGIAGPSGRRGRLSGVWLPRRLRGWLSRWRHRALSSALASLVREHGHAHVHAEFADLPGLLALGVARAAGISFSLGVHALDVHRPRYALGPMLGQARFVTACNQAALRAVLTQHPRAKAQTHFIPHGVDLTRWPYRSRPYAPHAELQLLYAGRFVPKKGVDTLLQALATLRGQGFAARLAVAGEGPLAAAWRDLARALAVDATVNWLGVLSHAALREQLERVDCLVVPSRVGPDGDRDGVPNIVLEAMAAGVPVVGTTAGSLGEVLSSRTGWTFPTDDAAALAAVLGAVAGDPATVEARRTAARALVEERFDARRLAEQRVALFQEILKADP